MGICPREHVAGHSYCKYEVIDEDFEMRLLDFLKNHYKP